MLLMFGLNTAICLCNSIVMLLALRNRGQYKLTFEWLKKFANGLAIAVLLCLLLEFIADLTNQPQLFSENSIYHAELLYLHQNAMQYIPLFMLILVIAGFRNKLKNYQFDELAHTDQTTGNYGSASFADKTDLERINVFDINNGYFIGADGTKPLYFPMYNKLTISPPGGGKTTTSSIPILLSHNGPAFVFDVKGELWAVTARYRTEVMNRQVVVIDPFGVTQGEDFQRGKPESLRKKYKLNPFDWLPSERMQRDRMINSFSASFIINSGGYSAHFDDNAKILIRGYIDYLMSQEELNRDLPTLYKLMSEKLEEAQDTFDKMSECEGRAGAAANQINRVGSDERGSILSTSYRQIDWMGDSNAQDCLSSSNFDLHEFLKGNMDIFVVLPEDQVKEHNRLFRMIMSLIMSMIVQAKPTELPQKKMLFLLEELAQLGAVPDVEQCIEVMRTRGVIVWTVFQSLKQIELFSKPDLFLSVPLKQIFTNDDIKTMQWIQNLAGKKTILTKTLSTNTGDTRQKMQAFGGGVSSGEGESIHETGVDLIQINEIRELPNDEQFVFVHGTKPIRCKKVRYFENTLFAGKYDLNTLETKH